MTKADIVFEKLAAGIMTYVKNLTKGGVTDWAGVAKAMGHSKEQDGGIALVKSLYEEAVKTQGGVKQVADKSKDVIKGLDKELQAAKASNDTQKVTELNAAKKLEKDKQKQEIKKVVDTTAENRKNLKDDINHITKDPNSGLGYYDQTIENQRKKGEKLIGDNIRIVAGSNPNEKYLQQDLYTSMQKGKEDVTSKYVGTQITSTLTDTGKTHTVSKPKTTLLGIKTREDVQVPVYNVKLKTKPKNLSEKPNVTPENPVKPPENPVKPLENPVKPPENPIEGEDSPKFSIDKTISWIKNNKGKSAAIGVGAGAGGYLLFGNKQQPQDMGQQNV